MIEANIDVTRLSPFQGLAPFAETDSLFFFGREREVRLITAHMFASPLTIIYGPSGVGKTSLLNAGVLNNLSSREDVVALVFREWDDNPLVGLKKLIIQLIERYKVTTQTSVDTPLEDLLVTISQGLKRHLMIILDQFEDYFFRSQANAQFASAFSKIVMMGHELSISFLIAIREDVLAKLDMFEESIPILFENYLRIGYLMVSVAREVILKPIQRYNDVYTPSPPIAIEPELVDSLLDESRLSSYVGRPSNKTSETDYVETPILQLILTDLWEQEVSRGSHILRFHTFQDIGGARHIVENHLQNIMDDLSETEQDVAAEIFDRLVTPSGNKMAFSVDDLASYLDVPSELISSIVEKLSTGDRRILHPVPSPMKEPKASCYEVFHDILVPSIQKWRVDFINRKLDNQTSLLQYSMLSQTLSGLGGTLIISIWAILLFIFLYYLVAPSPRLSAGITIPFSNPQVLIIILVVFSSWVSWTASNVLSTRRQAENNLTPQAARVAAVINGAIGLLAVLVIGLTLFSASYLYALRPTLPLPTLYIRLLPLKASRSTLSYPLLFIEGEAEVLAEGGVPLYEADTTGQPTDQIRMLLFQGQIITVAAGPTEFASHVMWLIRTPDGVEGWVPALTPSGSVALAPR